MTDRKLAKTRLKAFEDNIEAANGCGPGTAIRGYLDAAYKLADQITGDGSNNAKIEQGFISAFHDLIDGANGCGPGTAIRGYLDLAYELADKVISVEGGFKGRAASELEKGLLRAFNHLAEGANGCYPGIAQRGYLDLAYEIADKLASLENGLSDHAALVLGESLEKVLDRAIEKAYGCSPGIAQKEWLELVDEVENKFFSIRPGACCPLSQYDKKPNEKPNEKPSENPAVLPEELRKAMAKLKRPIAPGPG